MSYVSDGPEGFKSPNFVNSSHPQAKISTPHMKKIFPKWPLIIALFLLISIGISYFFYTQQKIIVQMSPQERIMDMFKRMGTVNSFAYTLNASAEIPDEILQQASQMGIGLSGDLQLSSQGFIDQIDIQNSKTQQSWRVNVGNKQQNTLILDMDTKMIDQKKYFMINDIMSLMFLDLNFLKNKWVQFNTEDLQQLGVEVSDSNDYELFHKYEKEIQELVENTTILQVEEELPSRKQDGEIYYIYRVNLHEANLISLFQAIKKMDDRLFPGDSITSMREILDNIEFENFIIAIGENMSYLYEFSTNVTFMDNSIPDIHITMSLNEFNQSFEIQSPLEYLSIIEFSELINNQLLIFSQNPVEEMQVIE